jgi:GDP-D-mannose dehydratase
LTDVLSCVTLCNQQSVRILGSQELQVRTGVVALVGVVMLVAVVVVGVAPVSPYAINKLYVNWAVKIYR